MCARLVLSSVFAFEASYVPAALGDTKSGDCGRERIRRVALRHAVADNIHIPPKIAFGGVAHFQGRCELGRRRPSRLLLGRSRHSHPETKASKEQTAREHLAEILRLRSRSSDLPSAHAVAQVLRAHGSGQSAMGVNICRQRSFSLEDNLEEVVGELFP